jgi:N-acetylglucosaminyldiphosphoundecaprenol N-acetyl-beta-D-mannosaminyltransferase
MHLPFAGRLEMAVPRAGSKTARVSSRLDFGYAHIDRTDMEQTVERILQLARRGTPAMVVTPNSDHIVKLESDAGLRAAYDHAEVVVADGMPIVWASKLLGEPLKERVTGADLMPRLCGMAALHGLKVFILGGRDGVPQRAALRLQTAYPGLKVAGSYSPPFGFETDRAQDNAIVQMITDSDADLVFVGLGAPKQELWIDRHLATFRKGVFLGIGAAVDFCAGNVSRAPHWMQSAGLEWMYRWSQDPSRLTARYAKDFYVFVVLARELHRRRVAARKLT